MPISTTITPIEIGGEHGITVGLDGREQRYGPYPDADAAEAMARRFAGVCQVLLHSGVVAAPLKRRRGAPEIRHG